MARIRSWPGGQRFPSLKGDVIVDAPRGQVRVRSWPKKRGTPKDPYVRQLNQWFKDANRAAKKADPNQQRIAIEMSKGTGLYPRDILLKAMSSGFYELHLDDGRVMLPTAPFVEAKVFNGCRVQENTTQALAAGTFTTLTWPLPIIDSAGFWNVSAPTRLTIPQYVEVVSIQCWYRTNASKGGRSIPAIFLNGSEIARFEEPAGTALHSKGVQQIAMPVNQGDYFEFKVFVDQAVGTAGNRGTFMVLTVEQATVP